MLFSCIHKRPDRQKTLAVSAAWSTNLFAFFLLTVFADKVAAFSGDNCHVGSSIFHRDDRFWLQQTTNKHSA